MWISRFWTWAAWAAACTACSSALGAESAADPPQAVPYFSDFQAGTTTGWNGAKLSSTSAFTKFLGNYGLSNKKQQSTDLRVKVTKGVSYTVIFDLYLIDTWDGEHAKWGPDRFCVKVDGDVLFLESFEHSHLDAGATYAGTYDVGGSNLGFGGATDVIYRGLSVSFVPKGSTAKIVFEGAASEVLNNESWGIDNVRVVETSKAGEFVPLFVDASRSRGWRQKKFAQSDPTATFLWGDLNGDGRADGVVTGTTTQAYRFNPTKKTFSITGVGGLLTRQCALADLDNDGDLDLVGFRGANAVRFSLNNGKGSLADAGALGVTTVTGGDGLAALDADADGWIDLLLPASNGNWIARNQGVAATGPSGSPDPAPKKLVDSGDGAAGHAARPAFKPSTNDWPGIASAPDTGDGNFVSTADATGDGRADAWYHMSTGRLFVAEAAGGYRTLATSLSMLASDALKVGSAWGDYDNDGDADLFIPGASKGSRGTLWRNDGEGAFVEVGLSAGLKDAAGQRSACWGDVDNDGDLDLYIVARGKTGQLLYLNDGDGTFSLGNHRARLVNVEATDASLCDYDLDGDLDLAVAVIGGSPRLFENSIGGERSLLVRFVGIGQGGTNTAGIGVSLTLYDGEKIIGRRELGSARGSGAEPMVAHFGGVEAGREYELRVATRGRTYRLRVTPAETSSVIGGTSFAKYLTIGESDLTPHVRVVRWRETTQDEE